MAAETELTGGKGYRPVHVTGREVTAMPERRIQNVVITGPTGAIGAALCEELLKHGCMVYAVCRPDSQRTAALPGHDRLKIVHCDLADFEKLPDLIRNPCDALFHFAWAHTIGPGRNDMPVQISNIRYAINAVRAAAALGCNVFVGAGSQAEYGRVEGLLRPETPCFPENGYGMAKLCAGQMSRTEAHKLGMAHIWARILSVYGPHDGQNTLISTAIRQLLAGQCPALTAGEQLWDYLYAADASEALYGMACCGRDGAVYPLGSGERRPLREYIAILRDAIDPALPLGLGEIPYGPGQVMHLQADITDLHRDTGFTPKTEFAVGIEKTIEWMRKHA